MYGGYDQMRQIMEGYRLSIGGQMETAISASSLLQDQYKAQLSHQAELLLGSLSARNVFDQLRLERNLIAKEFQSLYRPTALAHIEAMFAKPQAAVAETLRSQVTSGLTEVLADKQKLLEASRFTAFDDSFLRFKSGLVDILGDKQRFLEASQLAAFNDSYSKLAEIQRSLAEHVASLGPRLEDLRPLLNAQLNWSRTFSPPSSVESIRRFAVEATALSRQIAALHSAWEVMPADLDGQEEKEQTEKVIALANERLAGALKESSPTATLWRIGELLRHLKAGGLHLSPSAGAILVALLVNLAASLIYDCSKELVKGRRAGEVPRVCKEVKGEVRRIRKDNLHFVGEFRVVIASELIVRKGPGLSTPAIGRLFVGDLITKIKTRNRSWTLVEFQDEAGEIVLKGWVFSRYIKPLKGVGVRGNDLGLRRSPGM